MEFIRGAKVNDHVALRALGFEPARVAAIVNRVFNEQIFVHGFVHCDPHPGNLFVRPRPDDPRKPQLVLIDNGLYRQYSNEFRSVYCVQ